MMKFTGSNKQKSVYRMNVSIQGAAACVLRTLLWIVIALAALPTVDARLHAEEPVPPSATDPLLQAIRRELNLSDKPDGNHPEEQSLPSSIVRESTVKEMQEDPEWDTIESLLRSARRLTQQAKLQRAKGDDESADINLQFANRLRALAVEFVVVRFANEKNPTP